jgi:hypothetical protein
MGGIPHDHYEPKSKMEKAIDSRLPIIGLLYDTIMVPTPKKPELDVDLGYSSNFLFSASNNYRHSVGYALYATCGPGFCLH